MSTSPNRMLGVGASFSSIVQGEKVVGSGTVQLVSTSTPCIAVWVGAPTANHTVGETNTGNILVGGASGGNASGGRTLENDDYDGFLVLCADASLLYLTGFNAGDVVEYQIYQ